MHIILLISALTVFTSGCLAAGEDAFRARLRVEESRNMILNRHGMAYLPCRQVQKGDGIFFEAEQMHGLTYNYPDVRLARQGNAVSLIHVRFLEFRFDVVKPGAYRAWYRASFPTDLGYMHGECMDGGEVHSVEDSIRLAPNVWRWHKGPLYRLENGGHVWSFPSPHAWCGGAKLDCLILAPETMADAPERVRPSETEACLPARGEILLRRIKASLLREWSMRFDTELNGGSFTAEYRYDGGNFRKIRLAEWERVPENAEYLFFRLRMERAEKSGLSPFVHNLELFVREK